MVVTMIDRASGQHWERVPALRPSYVEKAYSFRDAHQDAFDRRRRISQVSPTIRYGGANADRQPQTGAFLKRNHCDAIPPSFLLSLSSNWECCTKKKTCHVTPRFALSARADPVLQRIDQSTPFIAPLPCLSTLRLSLQVH